MVCLMSELAHSRRRQPRAIFDLLPQCPESGRNVRALASVVMGHIRTLDITDSMPQVAARSATPRVLTTGPFSYLLNSDIVFGTHSPATANRHYSVSASAGSKRAAFLWPPGRGRLATRPL